jgi:patatin-like phospholipase/acyl hydrolase
MEKESLLQSIKRKLEELEKIVNELIINKPKEIDEDTYEITFRKAEKMIEKIDMDEDPTACLKFQCSLNKLKATYYQVIGDEQSAKNLLKKVKQLESFVTQEDEMQEIYENSQENSRNESNENKTEIVIDKVKLDENISSSLEILLKNISQCCSEEMMKNIEELFYLFNQHNPKTYIEYVELERIFLELSSMLNDFQKDESIELNFSISHKYYFKRMDFIKRLHNTEDIIQPFFGDVIKTQEKIKKRFRELASQFHPDCTWIRKEDKKMSSELFSYLTMTKDKILKGDFNNHPEFYEEEAQRFLDQANDFLNCSNGKKEKVKDLSIFNQGLSKNVLLKFCKEAAKKAYDNYREAARIADKNEDVKKQIIFRSKMTECFVLMECPVEAKVYAFSTYQLFLKKIGIIEALKNKNQLSLDVEKCMILAEVIEKQLSVPEDESKINTSINDLGKELIQMSGQLLIKAEGKLVDYYSNKEIIQTQIRRANLQKGVGMVMQTMGVATAGTGVGGAYYAVTTVGSIGGPIGVGVAMIIGLAVWGLWKGGEAMIKKGIEHQKEPEVRKKLNEIIEKAVQHYNEGDFLLFMEELAKPFDSNVSLIEIKTKKGVKTDVKIEVDKFVSELLKRGFRPDGISYLLNIIGESLISGKLNNVFRGKTMMDLRGRSKSIYEELVANEDLEKKAKELDDEIFEIRKNSMKSYFLKLKDFVFFGDNTNIAEEYIKSAGEMTFGARLQEMKNVAKINIAIIRILMGGKDDIVEAKKIFIELKNYTKTNQLYKSMTRFRMEVLDDLFWILSGEQINEHDENLYLMPGYNYISNVFRDEKLFLSEELTTIDNNLFIPEQLDKYFFTSKDTIIETLITRVKTLQDIKLNKDYFTDNFKNVLESAMKIDQIFETKEFIEHLRKQSVIKNKYLKLVALLCNVSVETFTIEHRGGDYCFQLNDPMSFRLKGSLRTVNLVYDKLKELYVGVLKYTDITRLKDDFEDLGQRVEVLRTKANFFEIKSREDDKEFRKSSSVEYLVRAKNFYQEIYCYTEDIKAAFSYVKCMSSLCKYSECLKFLIRHKQKLSEASEFWYWMAICNRKIMNYTQAQEYLILAHSTPVDDELAQRIKNEEIVLTNLLSINYEEKILKMKPIETLFDENYYMYRNSELLSYKILSVDGGGIRGILPAMMLAEIEKETKRPISHLFNMVSGTSTGAIISCGLTITDDGLRPKYSASDMIELYATKADQIFQKGYFFQLNPKYQNVGRKKLFKNYFGDLLFGSGLNDILVPACNTTHLNQDHLFTHFKASKHSEEDLFYDVLMATTAAPTYFEPHLIAKYNGHFIDGGVHLNNPALEAYLAASHFHKQREANDRKYFVVSLGTGNYIPDNFDTRQSFSLLFWLKNVTDILISTQEANTDINMHRLFQKTDNQYLRFQPELDKVYSLDDYKNIPSLVETAFMFIEDLKNSDDNKFNNLIESLDINNKFIY